MSESVVHNARRLAGRFVYCTESGEKSECSQQLD